MTTLQPHPTHDTETNSPELVGILVAGATQTRDPLLRADSACHIGTIKYYDNDETRASIHQFIETALPDNLREIIDGLTFALETNTHRHPSQYDPTTGLIIEPTYAPAYRDLNPPKPPPSTNPPQNSSPSHSATSLTTSTKTKTQNVAELAPVTSAPSSTATNTHSSATTSTRHSVHDAHGKRDETSTSSTTSSIRRTPTKSATSSTDSPQASEADRPRCAGSD